MKCLMYGRLETKDILQKSSRPLSEGVSEFPIRAGRYEEEPLELIRKYAANGWMIVASVDELTFTTERRVCSSRAKCPRSWNVDTIGTESACSYYKC